MEEVGPAFPTGRPDERQAIVKPGRNRSLRQKHRSAKPAQNGAPFVS